MSDNGPLLVLRHTPSVIVALLSVLLPSLETPGLSLTHKLSAKRAADKDTSSETYTGTSRVGSGQAKAQCPLTPQL